MSLNDNALTTIENINLAIGQADIERYINTASTIIENHCNTRFKKDSYSEKYKPSGEKYLSVNYWNIESIDNAEYNGEAIDEYTLLGNRGMIYKEDAWPDAGDYLLDITLTAGFILPNDDTATRDLPEDIESACIVLVSHIYKMEQSGGNVKRKTRGGVSTTYFEKRGLPDTVKYLLSTWRFKPV